MRRLRQLRQLFISYEYGNRNFKKNRTVLRSVITKVDNTMDNLMKDETSDFDLLKEYLNQLNI